MLNGPAILSINLNHDGAGVILSGGRLAAYVNTERFSRIKKQPGIRDGDLDSLLRQAGLGIEDIHLIILENYGCNYPDIEQKYKTDFKDTFVKFTLHPDGTSARIRGVDIPCIVNYDHFLCHSAAAYYFSPYESAMCFAYDPMGSGCFIGNENKLYPCAFPVSLAGLLYDRVSSEFLPFGGLFGAGKTMGLAPYGEHADAAVSDTLRQFADKGISRPAMEQSLEFIDLHAKNADALVEGKYNARYAYLAQELLELSLSRILKEMDAFMQDLQRVHGVGVEPNLCLGGGAALNSVANQKCFESSPFNSLYLHPACGDDGTAIGAALYHWHHVMDNPKIPRTNREAMYSVKTYGEATVRDALEKHRHRLTVSADAGYIASTARLLADGKIIGWFHGASEIGPRALGNRSILCNPALPHMKDTLNSRVKFREGFRPFAPSVMREHAADWFDIDDSPFMLRVAKLKRGGVPAITHCDGTARVQTVRREDNPPYYDLIQSFHRLTGVPMLLNTSFNIKGEPIVETPLDAVASFLDSDIDALVFPGLMVTKNGR